jgi:tetratricopeptide (TPR) repeat protein
VTEQHKQQRKHLPESIAFGSYNKRTVLYCIYWKLPAMSSQKENNPQAGQGKPLPKKEADLFRAVIKYYETKLYKKGVKSADGILKKYPKHGETLAMKGLILNCLNKKEEAHELVKLGLMNDMRWVLKIMKSPVTLTCICDVLLFLNTTVEARLSTYLLSFISQFLTVHYLSLCTLLSAHRRPCLALPLSPFSYINHRSHVCWHVYGLLYRSDRLYNEAIKAYKQALRIDHDNLQILRDLSLLQIQMRDLPGYESTRHQILDLKPNQKIHWLSFALSKHLCDDHEGCLSVIDSYLGTLDDDAVEKKRGFESSELALYQYEVMSEIPNNEQASLDYLDKCFDIVVDQTSWLSSKGRGQLMLGDYASAQQSYMKLFERGSTEDYQVHTGYMCALLELPKEVCDYALNKSRGGGAAMKGMDTIATIYPLTADQRATLLTAYTSDLVNRFPISKAAKRIPLTLLNGTCEEFKSAVNVYCRKLLVKGVPSLGADLGYLLLMPRPDGAIPPIARAYDLAKDPVDAKAHPIMAVLESVADGYITSLNTTDRTFPESDVEESPSTYLWALYLRAKLHEFCGEYSEGLKRIEDALEHTPTLVDLYELKGRLLKLSGDLDGAYQSLEEGRELDLQDRYINNKTIKYTLRAGKDDLAAERVALFTKDEGNPEQHMFDMQCTWYELELAACYANKRNWGKALKKYSKYMLRGVMEVKLPVLFSFLPQQIVKHSNTHTNGSFSFVIFI